MDLLLLGCTKCQRLHELLACEKQNLDVAKKQEAVEHVVNESIFAYAKREDEAIFDIGATATVAGQEWLVKFGRKMKKKEAKLDGVRRLST